MLELAYLNQEALNKSWQKCLTAGIFFFYFFDPVLQYKVEIVNNDWNILQYVSKNNAGEINGFFAAYINRNHNYVENIDIINLTEKSNIIFIVDLVDFLEIILIKRNFRKAVFHAISDNPATKSYGRYIKRYNLGTIVGVLKQSKLLLDGKYHDEMIYEIYRENFFEFFKKLKKNK
ncbi:MAG: hypothetical protein LBE13_05090 [Bacteroidales bacterium]|jgi:hypothetical protein|nr:hypothetical protein [Bacteroidales bacterium]